MNKILFLFCFFVLTSGYGQDTIRGKEGQVVSRKTYVSLNKIRADGTVLTKADSLNFRYRNGDTLVLVRPGIDLHPKTFGNGQDTIQGKERRVVSRKTYVSLNKIRMDGTVLTKEDSLNFRYYNGDTLVLVKSGTDLTPKRGVKVRYIPKDSLFLQIYEDVVYGKEPSKNGKKNTLKLWKEEVKVYFDSSVTESHKFHLMSFASEISSGIDSLRISEVTNREEANYFVHYRKDSTAVDPEPRINGERAGYYVNWNGRQELTRGILKINTYEIPSPVHQITLLRWHFLKSLGYFKYSDLLDCESYFSECSEGGPISDKDLEILKYHYSYSNCVGNDRESFQEFHKTNQGILKKNPDAIINVVHL